MRPRIRKAIYTPLKKGDVIRGYIANLSGVHTIIVLEDEAPNQDVHTPCLPICNFTGTEVAPGEFAIDVSVYIFPPAWFERQKQQTWLRCNFRDCVKAIDQNRMAVVGNLLPDHTALLQQICYQIQSCPIAPRLQDLCNCTYKSIQQAINSGILDPCDCKCST